MSDLPTGWTLRRLTEVVDFPEGQVDPTRRPYAAWPLVAPDQIEPRTGRLIRTESAASQGAISGKYPVRPKDVIYSKIRPALRKAVLVDFEGLCSADMYPLRVGEELHPRYLLAVLLSERFSRFAEAVSGRSGIPKINRRELAEYELAVPPLGEQRRIAGILDALDEEKRRAGYVIEKYRSVDQALIGDLMAGRGVASPVEYVLSSHVLALTGGMPQEQAEINPTGTVPVYGSSGLAGFGNRALSEGETIVIGRVGEGGVGSVRHAPGPCWVTDNALWSTWINSDWLPEFLAMYLDWYDLRKLRSQTGQPLITQSAIGKVPVPVVPRRTQEKVIAVARSLRERHEASSALLEKKELVRQGLVEKLLTGQVRV